MSTGEEIDRLTRQVDALSSRVNRLEDENAVKKLQYIYGYYLDKLLFDHIIDLFAEDSEVHFMGGRFRGKAGVRRFFETMSVNYSNGQNRPAYGMLTEHPMFQDIVTIGEDGLTAQGRFRLFLQIGWHDSVRDKRPAPKGDQGVPQEVDQWWEGGVYENEFVKEDGIWKIKLLHYRMVFFAPYDGGWAHVPTENVPSLTRTYPEEPNGPDEILPKPWKLWPHMEVIHFHFPHPVTGAIIPHDD